MPGICELNESTTKINKDILDGRLENQMVVILLCWYLSWSSWRYPFTVSFAFHSFTDPPMNTSTVHTVILSYTPEYEYSEYSVLRSTVLGVSTEYLAIITVSIWLFLPTYMMVSAW
jgi:hypothetical protein